MSDYRTSYCGLWGMALAAVILAGLFFSAVVAAQLTSDGAGQRILGRAVAVITEIDATLPDIQADLQEAAEGSTAAEVRVPNFPIPIDLPRDEALQMEAAVLRARLLDEAAARLYDDGMSVWAEGDPEADQAISRISSTGALRGGLGLIRDSSHTFFLLAAIVLGLLAAVPVILLTFSLRSYARLVALGVVVLAAALPSLALAIALRYGIRTVEDEGDPFVTGLVSLADDALWVPVRDYLALTALGLAVIAVGVLALLWPGRAEGEADRFRSA
ncbi:MAG: hypothetical protein V3S00_03570 [Dehalococcoidia bacterium]